jgi:RHS repeat-associated protein
LTEVKQYDSSGTLTATIDYSYDAFGELLERTSGGTTTKYALDGWNPNMPGGTGNANFNDWAILNSDNTLQTRNVFGNQPSQVLARVDQSGASDPAGTYWLLEDHLNSVRDVMDNSGAVKDSIAYDGFGNITSESNSSYRGWYAWTGRQRDVATGLQYNNARWYGSLMGRWLTEDPSGFDAGDSNLYRYVNNAPTGATDPSGRDLFASGDASKNYIVERLQKAGVNVTAYPMGPDIAARAANSRNSDKQATMWYIMPPVLPAPASTVGEFAADPILAPAYAALIGGVQKHEAIYRNLEGVFDITRNWPTQVALSEDQRALVLRGPAAIKSAALAKAAPGQNDTLTGAQSAPPLPLPAPADTRLDGGPPQLPVIPMPQPGGGGIGEAQAPQPAGGPPANLNQLDRWAGNPRTIVDVLREQLDPAIAYVEQLNVTVQRLARGQGEEALHGLMAFFGGGVDSAVPHLTFGLVDMPKWWRDMFASLGRADFARGQRFGPLGVEIGVTAVTLGTAKGIQILRAPDGTFRLGGRAYLTRQAAEAALARVEALELEMGNISRTMREVGWAENAANPRAQELARLLELYNARAAELQRLVTSHANPPITYGRIQGPNGQGPRIKLPPVWRDQ